MDFMKDKGSKGFWALEYSTEQKCFNLDTLYNLLQKNIRACLNDNNNDYQIIFIGTYEECNDFLKSIRNQKERNKLTSF